MYEPRKATILVVDDTPDNLNMMSGLLTEHFRVKVANSGERALRICAQEAPDLILLDIMMPGVDGYEVCRRLKAEPRLADVPIIFLTAKSEIEDERCGLALGAVDYITKPISPPLVLARIDAHLRLKLASDILKDNNAHLEREVARRTREIESLHEVTILMMASLAETRDQETGNHIKRTQHYVRTLAEALRAHPNYGAELDPHSIDLMFKSAPLHDIGKVGIPDAILLKPGKLDADEWVVMKTHTTLGRESIEHAEAQLGRSVDFLRFAKEIAYGHHEKWDGSGYPLGTKGEATPLSARLMALADVYDALISRRVYKAPMPIEQAVALILQGRGSHFDPVVVDAFIGVQERFAAIAELYADESGIGEALAAPPR